MPFGVVGRGRAPNGARQTKARITTPHTPYIPSPFPSVRSREAAISERCSCRKGDAGVCVHLWPPLTIPRIHPWMCPMSWSKFLLRNRNPSSLKAHPLCQCGGDADGAQRRRGGRHRGGQVKRDDFWGKKGETDGRRARWESCGGRSWPRRRSNPPGGPRGEARPTYAASGWVPAVESQRKLGAREAQDRDVAACNGAPLTTRRPSLGCSGGWRG